VSRATFSDKCHSDPRKMVENKNKHEICISVIATPRKIASDAAEQGERRRE
jgi:hypothetical protein